MNTWLDRETFEREVEAARRLGVDLREHLGRVKGWNDV